MIATLMADFGGRSSPWPEPPRAPLILFLALAFSLAAYLMTLKA